jgi:hypothetical protein
MKQLFALFLTGIACLVGIGGPRANAFQDATALHPQAVSDSFSAAPATDLCVLYDRAGGIGCRAATAEEADLLTRQDASLSLHQISPIDAYTLAQKDKGLQIVLRATQQMERFPEAKAAFLRAAAIWQGLIQTPITIVIDVDFGTTRFGEPYGAQVLGWTLPQGLTSNVYPAVRAQLIASAASEQERAIFNSLPVGSIATDIGNTTIIRAPSANGRALGLLDPVADPDGREKNLGPPPSIGFNSKAGFDFDPSNGIDADKVDFEAVVVHEIGHALGFMSSTTLRQIEKDAPLSLSVWDLFRLRPGISADAFATARRILTAGGEQVFSVAGVETALSTGATNLGGDGRGEWHWKDDALTGRYIGIMDPGLPPGRRAVMTAYDLLAIKLMGYTLKSGIEIAPEIGDLAGGRIQGDGLTITGLAVNVGSEVIEAQVKVLDDSGNTLAEYPLISFNPGKSPFADFSLEVVGLNQWRAATQARLTLIDRVGNHSAPITTGILKGDSGGPNLSSVKFDGSVLKLKGKRFRGLLSLEINGEVVVIANATVNGSGKKAQVAASAAELQLSSGPNRVRVISNGLRSNAEVLDF